MINFKGHEFNWCEDTCLKCGKTRKECWDNHLECEVEE